MLTLLTLNLIDQSCGGWYPDDGDGVGVTDAVGVILGV